MNKKLVRLTESDLHRIVKESVNRILTETELDWKTWQNAAYKAQEYRDKNPHKYDRNRLYGFQDMARKAFAKKYGLENQYNNGPYGGEEGVINLDNNDLRNRDRISVHGSREHDFGDEDKHSLNHNVYHFGKKYGNNGGYGRTRMWDYAHESTPEEFFDNTEKSKIFRDAEKEVDDYRNGKMKYVKGEGWVKK